MSTWVKLGEKATVFVDPATKLEVTSHTNPVEVPRMTKRIREALNGRHLIEVSESDISEETKSQARSLKEKNEEETNKILGISETSTDTKVVKGKGKGNKGKVKEAELSQEDKLKAMTPEQRLSYYKEEYEKVTEADAIVFKALSDEEQVAFLLDE